MADLKDDAVDTDLVDDSEDWEYEYEYVEVDDEDASIEDAEVSPLMEDLSSGSDSNIDDLIEVEEISIDDIDNVLNAQVEVEEIAIDSIPVETVATPDLLVEEVVEDKSIGVEEVPLEQAMDIKEDIESDLSSSTDFSDFIADININSNVFALAKSIPAQTIVGSGDITTINIKVGVSSYGWNVFFDNGLSMSVKDLQIYQSNNLSLPSPSGTIKYGQKEFPFSNIKHIIVYEEPQFFEYKK